jgi:hypothetical protein
MELPEDVVALIREFSRPLTRPNWRTLHLMSNDEFHMSAMERFASLFYELVITARFKMAHYQYRVFDIVFIYKP